MATDYGLDDYGQPLQASGSLGLAPLPAQNMPAEPFVAPPAVAMPQQAPAPTLPGNSLGLAPPRPTRDAEDQQFLADLPTADKFGLMLQSFAAGVHGGPNPVDAVLMQRRKARADTQAELGNTLINLGRGYDILDKVSEGPEKNALREMMGRQMPEFAHVFAAHGSADETSVKEFLGNMTPSVQKYLTDKCSMYPGAKGRRECFVKTTNDDSERKHMESLSIQDSTPGTVSKVAAFAKWASSAEGPPELKGPDGKATFNMGQIAAINEKLKAASDPRAMTPAEMHALSKTQENFAMYGLVPDSVLKAKALDEAKAANDVPKMRTRIQGEKEIQEEWDAKTKTWKEIGSGPRFAKQVASPGDAGGLTPQAIALLAKEAEKDKGVLANIGRGVQGAKDLRAIINKMGENLEGKSGPGLADRRARFNSDRRSLDQIVPKYDAITAFENSAIAQGKVLVGLAQKVDTTGMPVMERWIRAGRKSIAGDEDVSEFHAQIYLFRAEAAKILTNPNLTGVVTDTARKEVEDFLPDKASAKQIERVVKRLEADFILRKTTMADQIQEIKDRMTAGGDAPSSAAAPASGSAKEGERSISKSGKPIVRRNGKWEYE